MAYTAQTLITRAWYLSGIVARGLQNVSGEQINDGLYLLNALLDFKQIEIDQIPYWTYIELPAVPAQEFYFLPYVAAVESVTFNIDVVRYPMESTSRRKYYATSRVDNISSLPFDWNYQRGEGGGTLGLYFKPDNTYPLKLMVKIFLTDVELQTDLTNINTIQPILPYSFINTANQGFDTSYIEYLRNILAQYMLQDYGLAVPPSLMQNIKRMEHNVMYISPPDMSLKKSSVLTEGVGYNWGDVNIGRGWRPD